MGLDGGAEGVLQQLGEDVVEGHLDVGEGGVDVAGDLDGGHVAVAVLGDLLDEGHPPLDHTLQVHPHVDDADVTLLRKKETKNITLINHSIIVPNHQTDLKLFAVWVQFYEFTNKQIIKSMFYTFERGIHGVGFGAWGKKYE